MEEKHLHFILHYQYHSCWWPGSLCSTAETLYNTVNFCWSTHKRHSIAGVSFVSSKGNILCRLIKIELYKIFAIINRAIKGLHCSQGISSHVIHQVLLVYSIHCTRRVEHKSLCVLSWIIKLFWIGNHLNGLVQERRNSSASAMELRPSWTKPSI